MQTWLIMNETIWLLIQLWIKVFFMSSKYEWYILSVRYFPRILIWRRTLLLIITPFSCSLTTPGIDVSWLRCVYKLKIAPLDFWFHMIINSCYNSYPTSILHNGAEIKTQFIFHSTSRDHSLSFMHSCSGPTWNMKCN